MHVENKQARFDSLTSLPCPNTEREKERERERKTKTGREIERELQQRAEILTAETPKTTAIQEPASSLHPDFQAWWVWRLGFASEGVELSGFRSSSQGFWI